MICKILFKENWSFPPEILKNMTNIEEREEGKRKKGKKKIWKRKTETESKTETEKKKRQELR